MVKKFLLDTNILMRSPRAIYVFEENDVYICNTTLEELDDHKTKPGDAGYNAREAIRILRKLRETSGLLNEGVKLPDGGTFKVVPDSVSESTRKIPNEWSLNKPDNRIINTAANENAILVTNDISMMLKAESAGIKVEQFKNEQVSSETMKYTGRSTVYATKEVVDKFYKNGKIHIEELYEPEKVKLEINEFVIIEDIYQKEHTALGYYNGTNIKKLRYDESDPCNIRPRNVGQRFAIEALMTPADQVPLCILKGSAGTSKTFLSLAAGLEQVMNMEQYRKVLILRPNIKFDDDIGYLKGTEMDKILPLIRPCLDNLEILVGSKDDNNQMRQDKIDELFERGYVKAEALAYLRGRSISNSIVLIDEAQNTTPSQILGIITRAGAGSKIILAGDPDQIDNPKLDKRNNGLVFASEKMKGSKLCMQMTFDNKECVRSPLALEASNLLKQ